MDYKSLIWYLRRAPNSNIGMTPEQPLEWDAADAIADLLTRAEAAEEEAEQLRNEHMKIQYNGEELTVSELCTRLREAEARAEKKIKQLTPCVDKGITVATTPLTLEQLRKIYGQPVWVKSLINDNPGEWCILRAIQMGKGWFLSFSGSQHVYGDQAEYGKTWIAYAYPPAHIDRCAYDPPSSGDGKPCSFCPASKKED